MKGTSILVWLELFVFFVLSSASAKPTACKSKSSWTQQDKLTEQLDLNGDYILSWEINTEGVITFEIQAATTGFVGLGISPTGKMTGADIFIAGVNNGNGLRYFGDFYADRNGPPLPDNRTDWVLHDVNENGTHTFIRASRLLNTCDNQDYPITEENTARVIWALGDTDNIGYHGINRGTKSINLINVPEPDVDLDRAQRWDVIVNTTMPSADTTYWCTIHKGPPLDTKHHVIGFDAVITSQAALKHTHHFIISKCTPPEGVDADQLFGPYLNHPGEECNIPTSDFPNAYCQGYLFVWAVGGKRTLFPLNVGYPLLPGAQDAYYRLEVHYDNPDHIEFLKFDTGIRIYYTNETRQYDAALLSIGHDTTQTLLVPPNQTDFVISGHCSPSCTSIFPTAGLRVFNVLLHSHLSGRKLKLRHFRDGVELPWFAFDDTYDFDFQQNKPLREEVIIMPWDQITYECTYDSAWAGGKTIVGGLSSREEMCLTFLWTYTTDTGPSGPQVDVCGSMYPVNVTMADFGITNYTSNGDSYVIWEPEQYAGMIFDEFLNDHVNWTQELIESQQEKHRYGVHDMVCCAKGYGCADQEPIRYPSVESEYRPEDPCQ